MRKPAGGRWGFSLILARFKSLGAAISVISVFLSIFSFALEFRPTASLAPLAPLDKPNVFPEFAVTNTGEVSLTEGGTECTVNAPGMQDVHIVNSTITNAKSRAMPNQEIPAGSTATTSCGVWIPRASEGTELHVRIPYRASSLPWRQAMDRYFRLVYDVDGNSRWDPDVGPSSAL